MKKMNRYKIGMGAEAASFLALSNIIDYSEVNPDDDSGFVGTINNGIFLTEVYVLETEDSIANFDEDFVGKIGKVLLDEFTEDSDRDKILDLMVFITQKTNLTLW